MDQVLFVLQDGKISQWNLSRGKLEAVKSHGLLQVPYSSKTAKAYWDDWKEDNQVVDGDVYDALFLSGGPNDFGKLPKWICANAKDKSAWTFGQLSLLANEADFKETGLCLVQGKVACRHRQGRKGGRAAGEVVAGFRLAEGRAEAGRQARAEEGAAAAQAGRTCRRLPWQRREGTGVEGGGHAFGRRQDAFGSAQSLLHRIKGTFRPDADSLHGSGGVLQGG